MKHTFEFRYGQGRVMTKTKKHKTIHAPLQKTNTYKYTHLVIFFPICHLGVIANEVGAFIN